ncbi:MAG: chemotaxis protein CheB [Hyphomicrobiales bacterium]|nr:chemotaxis protein CheB [Hyphomicrobiales bacterium]
MSVAAVKTGSAESTDKRWPLRRFGALSPRILAIGASTGGPQALSALLARLSPFMTHVPTVVVLHMPADFTDVVCEHVGRVSGRPTKAAANGDVLKAGSIYFAAHGQHLKVLRVGAQMILGYSDTPPENYCKPAVDVLFRSVADSFGPGACAIVLTGMGADGLAGAQRIIEQGGSVIAQDEASSVVWGMPGAVARAGLACALGDPAAIADLLAARLTGRNARESGQ